MTITHKFISNVTGRTAQAISAYAAKSTDTIYFEKDNRRVNAASLLGLLSLYILVGDNVTIITKGKDEESEAQTMCDLIDYMRGNEL